MPAVQLLDEVGTSRSGSPERASSAICPIMRIDGDDSPSHARDDQCQSESSRIEPFGSSTATDCTASQQSGRLAHSVGIFMPAVERELPIHGTSPAQYHFLERLRCRLWFQISS